MNEDKKKYELGYLISYKLTEGKEDKASQEAVQLRELIRQSGGEIIQEGDLLKRPLAYLIKKESEAYFGWLEFLILPEKIITLKNNFHLNPQILRFLILNKKQEGLKSKKLKSEKNLKSPPLQENLEDNSDLEKKLNELMVAVKK